jgi:hypothetical protein
MNKTAVAALLCLAPLASPAGDWEYSLAPYLWLPTISLDSSNANRGGLLPPLPGVPGRPGDTELSLGPTDYLSSLDFALMLAGDMRDGEWALKGDLIHLKFDVDDKDIDFLRPGTGPLAGTYGMTLTADLVTLAGGRTLVRADNYHMDALIGWRYIGIDLRIREQSAGDLIDTSLNFNDGFVAVSGRYRFDDPRWSGNYYADVGTGESDLTWQAVLGVAYQFGWGKLFANYRHLDYDFGDTKNFSDLSLAFSGPTVGARFDF